MDILITAESDSKHGFYFEAICGKTAAFVSFQKGGGLNACCKNSSHRVWRGAGKWYPNMAEAKKAYKSSEMQSILSAAETRFAEITKGAVAS